MKKSIGSYLLLMTVAVTANAQSYLGQWYSEENDTYLLFDADSLVFAYGVEPDNCYEFETLAHADDGEFITLSDIEGSVSFPYVLEADTLMITEEEGQTAYVASNLDLSALMNCAEIYSWSCGSQGRRILAPFLKCVLGNFQNAAISSKIVGSQSNFTCIVTGYYPSRK